MSPLLYTLLICDCSATFLSTHIDKFTDCIAAVGVIFRNDEMEKRLEVEHLEANSLCINVKKKMIIMDFRKIARNPPAPLCIGGAAIEFVSSFKYLEDLLWQLN